MGKALQFVQKIKYKQAKTRLSTIAFDMASKIPNQATLDDILLREDDDERRKQMFDYLKPALRFPDAKCPESPKRIIEC